MTNALSYAIKRVQHLCNLKIYSPEEPTKTVQQQNVKSVALTQPYMTSGVTQAGDVMYCLIFIDVDD